MHHPLSRPATSGAEIVTSQTQELLESALARRGLTRSQFLKGAAVAGAGVLLGPALLAREAAAAATGPTPGVDGAEAAGLSPLDLDFSVVEQFRPFALLARRFVQLDLRFVGVGASPYQGTGLHPLGQPATARAAGAALRLESVSEAATVFRTDARPVAPYASVVADLGAAPTAGRGEGAVLVGLVRDARNSVVASFAAGGDPARGRVSVDVVVGGQPRRLRSAIADLRGAVRVAFVVNENYVTALVGGATSWTPITQVRLSDVADLPDLPDLRDPAVLREHAYGFGVSGTDAVVELIRLQAGYFGQAGLRDPHVVTSSDGAPLIRGSKLYFTATNAGLSFFQAAHWGVWTLDLRDLRQIEQVGVLFFERDGFVLGDHAGHMVIDERDGAYHVAVSGWGDFEFEGVRVHYTRTREEVLTGVHVLRTRPMPLPTRQDSWDPHLVRIGERWYVGFVESPFQDPVRGFDFHPALARSPVGGTVLELERVGADLSRHQTEGVVLQEFGSRWYVMASDGDARRYLVYDLALRFLGTLDAPYVTNIPHPMVVPVPRGDRTEHLMLTFNGTQYYEPVLGYGTHGDFYVMRAAQRVG